MAVHPSSIRRPQHTPRRRLQPGSPAALGVPCLPLLPSGPGGVHRPPSRGAQPSAPSPEGRGRRAAPGRGVRPRYGGLRVQGTASSPSSTTIFMLREWERGVKGDTLPVGRNTCATMAPALSRLIQRGTQPEGNSMSLPLFRKVDSIQIPVTDLKQGLAFYRDHLGHELIWRTETAAGLRLPESDAEIVIQTDRQPMEIDFLVTSAEEAAMAIRSAGGQVVVQPFDISIGRCTVVRDPWGAMNLFC